MQYHSYRITRPHTLLSHTIHFEYNLMESVECKYMYELMNEYQACLYVVALSSAVIIEGRVKESGFVRAGQV